MLVSEIAKEVDGTVIGDGSIEITALGKIDQSIPGTIAFLSNKKYAKYLKATETVVFVHRSVTEADTTIIQVDDPSLAFVKTISFFYKLPVSIDEGVHPTAVIESSAKIGKNPHIGAHVYIGKNVIIGDNAIIHPNTTILEDCTIGDNARFYSSVSLREGCIMGNNVVIHNNAVIGADGFGFAPNVPKGFEKIHQVGIVRFEDDVEIGANACVDRASVGETVIKKGTKIDNLCQVAHNCVIGEHNVIAGLTGIAGSTVIGDWNQVGGCVAMIGHESIGNFNMIGGQSAIANRVGDNTIMMGSPAIAATDFKRSHVIFKQLPELARTVKKLKKLFAKELDQSDS